MEKFAEEFSHQIVKLLETKCAFWRLLCVAFGSRWNTYLSAYLIQNYNSTYWIELWVAITKSGIVVLNRWTFKVFQKRLKLLGIIAYIHFSKAYIDVG